MHVSGKNTKGPGEVGPLDIAARDQGHTKVGREGQDLRRDIGLPLIVAIIESGQGLGNALGTVTDPGHVTALHTTGIGHVIAGTESDPGSYQLMQLAFGCFFLFSRRL